MPRRRIGAAGTARWLGRLAAAEQIDRTLERSCIGRIVSLVILITMVACVGLWVGIAWLVNKAGLSGAASKLPGPVFPCLFFGGLILCIVIGGLVGNWLRRLAWRVILRFWR
ncbi:MAG: hypothetical protein ACUVWZ_16110 [Anaerolineae bacterium]